jgi:xanthine dehydrogenase accessory factor
VEVSGSAPRDPGAQMLITEDAHWGFLSGGCIEDDVARHGREAIAQGKPRILRYGEGSPWIDIRLACGSGITVLVEPLDVAEPAAVMLLQAYRARAPLWWTSDGAMRSASLSGNDALMEWDGTRYCRRFDPALRLVIMGTDATAVASAAMAQQAGVETMLISPGGPAEPLLQGLAAYHCGAAVEGLCALTLDRWTAVAVLSHDRDDDEAALAHALRSEAFYVGAIGARARLEARLERLRAHGVTEPQLTRLHAPIGLPGFGKSPRDIALSLVAEVARDFHSSTMAARSSGASISSSAPLASVSR